MARMRGGPALVLSVLGLTSIIGLPTAGLLWVGYTPCAAQHDVATNAARILLPAGFGLGLGLASASLGFSVASIRSGGRRGRTVSAIAVAVVVLVIAVVYGHGLLHPTDACA